MVKKSNAGEDKLILALNNLGLEFKRKQKIAGLAKDKKKFRKADFYLPEKNVYIEYFSTWNTKILNERERSRYIEKKGVLETNGVACIFIYPDEMDNVEQIISDELKHIEEARNPKPVAVVEEPVVEEKKVVVEKKVKKEVIVEDSGKDLEDVVEESNDESIEEDDDSGKKIKKPTLIVDEKPPANHSGGLIELLGGVAMVLIALEIIGIVLILLYILFK